MSLPHLFMQLHKRAIAEELCEQWRCLPIVCKRDRGGKVGKAAYKGNGQRDRGGKAGKGAYKGNGKGNDKAQPLAGNGKQQPPPQQQKPATAEWLLLEAGLDAESSASDSEYPCEHCKRYMTAAGLADLPLRHWSIVWRRCRKCHKKATRDGLFERPPAPALGDDTMH